MSTPTPRRPRPPSPTRQQLDELDDLLQRMLSLPVNPAAGGMPDAPAAPVAVEDASPPEEDAAPSPPDDVPKSAAPAPEEAPAAVAVAPPEAASPPAEEASPALAAPPLPSLLRPPWAAMPLWWRPLVWLNRFFDRHTFRLGALGRWLRRPAGRAALGWAGLMFLAAAAVLLARWIRWP